MKSLWMIKQNVDQKSDFSYPNLTYQTDNQKQRIMTGQMTDTNNTASHDPTVSFISAPGIGGVYDQSTN